MSFYYLYYVATEGDNGKWGVDDKYGAIAYEPVFDSRDEAEWVADQHNRKPSSTWEDIQPEFDKLFNAPPPPTPENFNFCEGVMLSTALRIARLAAAGKLDEARAAIDAYNGALTDSEMLALLSAIQRFTHGIQDGVVPAESAVA